MNYRRKKIFLTVDKKKYCIVRLYASKQKMRDDYGKDGKDILGAHIPFTTIKPNGKRWYYKPLTGEIYLSVENSGAGVVCHEFGHAVLWAWRHTRKKKQYPIIIGDLEEEEEVLHNLGDAISQFYRWFWKVTTNDKGQTGTEVVSLNIKRKHNDTEKKVC